jgi:hypothetical protein
MTTCTEIHWLKVSTFLTRAVFSTDAIDQTRIINFILSSIVIQARTIFDIGLRIKEVKFTNFNDLCILSYKSFLYFLLRNWIKIDLLLTLFLTLGERISLTKHVVRVLVISQFAAQKYDNSVTHFLNLIM